MRKLKNNSKKSTLPPSNKKGGIVVSKKGYRNDSPDKGEKTLIIPSGNITMKNVNFPVHGTDNLGNMQLMQPGMEYTFPGDYVKEIPMVAKKGGKYKKSRKQMGGNTDQQNEKWQAIIALVEQGIEDPAAIAEQLNNEGIYQTTPEEVQSYLQDFSSDQSEEEEQIEMGNGGSPKTQKMLNKVFKRIIEKKYGGECPEDSFGMENYIEDKRNAFLNRIQNNANIGMAVKYAGDVTNPKQKEYVPKAQMGLEYPFGNISPGMPSSMINPYAMKSFPNVSTQFMDGSQNWQGNNIADNGVIEWNDNPSNMMLKRWAAQYPGFNSNAFKQSADKSAYMNSLTGTQNSKQTATENQAPLTGGLNYPSFGTSFNQWDQFVNPGYYPDNSGAAQMNGNQNPYNSSQVGIYGNDMQQFQMQNQGQPTVTPQEFNTSKEATHNKYKMRLSNESLVNGAIVGGNQLAAIIENMRKQKTKQKTSADYIFTPLDAQTGSRGDYDVNSGDFRPDQKVPVQFPGFTAKMGGQNMYKEGGTYMMDEKQIAKLKKEGYQIDYL